jgi:tRNA (adenine57-N1/adenine58-N1)-methyltransferase
MTTDTDLTQPGDLVLLYGQDGKRFIVRLQPAGDLQTHHGVLKHDDLIGAEWGTPCQSHLGYPFVLLRPSLDDLLLHIRRRSQIVFPKEIGVVLLRLSVAPGKTIIEAGTGSGAMTTALAWVVGDSGRVHSFDRRADMQSLALENLQRLGLESRVILHLRDISEGFGVARADGLFLDLPTPELYLTQCRQAMRGGSTLAALLPTTNQVQVLIAALPASGFGFIEVCEMLQRFYKPVPARLRPVDRMVAHTGYLVFARAVAPEVLTEIPAARAEETDADSE